MGSAVCQSLTPSLRLQKTQTTDCGGTLGSYSFSLWIVPAEGGTPQCYNYLQVAQGGGDFHVEYLSLRASCFCQYFHRFVSSPRWV